jgi:hypothetical protein
MLQLYKTIIQSAKDAQSRGLQFPLIADEIIHLGQIIKMYPQKSSGRSKQILNKALDRPMPRHGMSGNDESNMALLRKLKLQGLIMMDKTGVRTTEKGKVVLTIGDIYESY